MYIRTVYQKKIIKIINLFNSLLFQTITASLLQQKHVCSNLNKEADTSSTLSITNFFSKLPVQVAGLHVTQI